MKIRPRFGVFAQLAAFVAGLAACSTLLALVIQDRTLSADLRAAAGDRLMVAAAAADRLMDDHLADVTTRYSMVSLTPEFRANLEAGGARTLEYHAQSLSARMGTAAIAFLTADRQPVATAGQVALARAAAERATTNAPSYLMADGRLLAAVSIPLLTGDSVVGHLLAVEDVGPDVLEAWSSVLGVEAGIGDEELASADTLVAVVRTYPEGRVRVSTTYEREAGAIARAREHLLVAGLAALVVAVLAALLVAHGFAGPIRRMKRAVERIDGGAVDVDGEFDVDRQDELGDLSRAFRDMLSRLRDSEARLSRVQRLARFTNWSIDPETGKVDAGADFRRLFDLDDEGDVHLDDLAKKIHAEDRDRFRADVDRAAAPGGGFRTEVRVPLRDGRHRVLHLRGQHRQADADVRRVEASAQDVTERWNSDRQIQYLSLYDPVTGLGNRQYLIERLGVQLKRAERNQTVVVLLTLGLDGFAEIESALGHRLGDELLGEVAERLVATLGVPRPHDRRRTRDPNSYAAVRIGTCEFAAVDGVRNREEAAALAEALGRVLERPYIIDDHVISLNVCIGISLFPDDATTVDALVRCGSTALQAGRSISDGYHFFDDAMEEKQVRRLRLATRLRRAIEGDELELHYQPRIRPASGRIVAVEALTRWSHEELGSVSPGEFIPVAEDLGLIQALGDWSLRTAARDLRAWRAAGLSDLRVSVNVSPQQLQPGIVERVLDLTAEIDPSSIELEVTESAVMRNPEEALELLSQLSGHGFRISLDDFGIGYSSLSYVRRLPLHTVKIDRSFIQDLATNEGARSIAQAVIMMCRAMGLESVGEGVETEEQRRTLVDLGCDELQGFLFAKAMPASELEKLVAAWTPDERKRTRRRSKQRV